MWVVEFLVYVVVLLLVVVLVRLFLVQPFLVPSGSMEQTLEVGDTIVAWKPGTPERGKIVVFRDDLGWLGPAPEAPEWKKALAVLKILPPQDEQYLVKRLIGLPGDHVTCCDIQGRVTVNGEALDESEYLAHDTSGQQVAPSLQGFDFVVPDGRMFVMGDNRNHSQDSRFWMCGYDNVPNPAYAFPSLDSIQGPVFAIMKPLNRNTTFSIPSTFADVPDPSGSPPDVSQDQWTCPLQGS